MMIFAGLSQSASGAYNAAALQVAIAEGSAVRRPVVIPAGTYTVDAIKTLTDEAGPVNVVCEMLSDMDLWGYGVRLILAPNQSTDASPTRLGMFLTNQVLTNVSFHGLTLDMNGASNPMSPSRPVSYNLFNQAHISFSGTPAGVAASGTDVLIDDCRFLNTAGVSCVVMAQSNTANVTLGKRWTIRGCQFINNGLDTNDHSSIYGWADDLLVDGCTFTADVMWGTVGRTGPVAAYEMHGANHRFVNNLVQNHYSGAWVAANKTSAVENGIIANNIFSPIAAIGVDFAREAANDRPVRKILICENMFDFTDSSIAPLGLKMGCQIEASYAIADVKFCDNRISKTGVAVASAGMYLDASTVAGQVHTGITFSGNVVRETVFGVFLKTSAANGIGVVEVGGNQFINLTATVSNPTSAGILVVNLPSPLEQLIVHPNTYLDDRNPGGFHCGILLGNGTIANLFVGSQSYRGVVTPYQESSLGVTNRSVQLTDGVTTPTEAVLVSGVDARHGSAVEVTLTAGRLVGKPLNPATGQQLTFIFVQNSTGGWAVTWHSIFKHAWNDTGNGPTKRSSIAFVFDGTNWNQDRAQTPYV